MPNSQGSNDKSEKPGTLAAKSRPDRSVAQRKNNNKQENRWAAVIVAIVFGGFSLVTTGLGVASLFDDVPIYAAILIGMAMSLVISTAVFRFYSAWFRREYWSRSMMFFIISCSVLASAVSATLASGVISFAAHQSVFQAERQSQALSEMTAPLIQVRDKARANADWLEAFSQDMLELSEREASRGDTCDGQTAGSICGVRCRMRKRLSEEAAEEAEKAKTVAAEAIETTSTASSITDNAQWAALYKSVATIADDGRIDEITRWARNTHKDFQEGFTDVETGRTFSCRDQSTENSLISLVALLEDKPRVDDAPPVRPVATFAYATSKNLAALSGMLLNFSGLIDNYDRDGAARMIGPLIFAMIVEAFIALSIYLAWYRRDTRPQPPMSPQVSGRPAQGGVSGFMSKVAPIIPPMSMKAPQFADEDKPAFEYLRSAYANGVFEEVGNIERGKPVFVSYFVQAISGIDELTRRAQDWVITELELEPSKWPVAYNVHELPMNLKMRIQKRFPGVEDIKIWIVPPKAQHRMKDIIRALGPTADWRKEQSSRAKKQSDLAGVSI